MTFTGLVAVVDATCAAYAFELGHYATGAAWATLGLCVFVLYVGWVVRTFDDE